MEVKFCFGLVFQNSFWMGNCWVTILALVLMGKDTFGCCVIGTNNTTQIYSVFRSCYYLFSERGMDVGSEIINN